MTKTLLYLSHSKSVAKKINIPPLERLFLSTLLIVFNVQFKQKTTHPIHNGCWTVYRCVSVLTIVFYTQRYFQAPINIVLLTVPNC